MYCPAHFVEDRREAFASLIEQHPLATIIANVNGQLAADHIPLMYEASAECLGRLIGHVARSNPLWQSSPEQELLVVFQGPSTYISPSWYATKVETGRVVPTWNYAVVHAHCTLRAEQDPQRIRQIIEALTKQQEAAQQHPWQVADAPNEFTERMIAHIVGVELPIMRIQGKWKVSQNQPIHNKASVIQGLRAKESDDAARMALLVERYADK
jgi:transcriptional regulator